MDTNQHEWGQKLKFEISKKANENAKIKVN